MNDTKNRRVFLSTLVSLFGAGFMRSIPLPALEWSERESTWILPGCNHIVAGEECGKPGVAIIKLMTGSLFRVQAPEGDNLGRGVGSRWIVVCEDHKDNYPDLDGIELDTKT